MNEIIARAVALGISIQQRIHCPTSDTVSINRAMKYLSSLGYKNPKRVLESYNSEGKIHIHKPHGSKNAKSSISICELNGVLLENEINKNRK